MRKNAIRAIAAICLIALLQSCGGSSSSIVVPPGGANIATVESFPNLAFTAPVALLHAPGDDSRWFVVQQAGQVMVFDNDPMVTQADVQLFIDISGSVACCGETGLLEMAFHPGFANNGQAFLSYTGLDPNNMNQLTSFVSQFTVNNGVLDPNSEQIIIQVAQPFPNHNGGHIAFGPDGFLYIGWGDGGAGNDPQENAQDTGNLLGAMLRIDVDGPNIYDIPPGNPFFGNTCGAGFCPEIYAYGLRNPWRWSFDRDTGELWAGDVGQSLAEEVNIIELGGNYGWVFFEGTLCNMNAPTVDCSFASLPPVAEYMHAGGPASITGGYIYRGGTITGLQGVYLYTDFYDGAIRQFFDSGSGNVVDEVLLQTNFNIPSFAEDIFGQLYFLDYASGTIHQIVTR
jgi:glucose/arabinose dehydrogenase